MSRLRTDPHAIAAKHGLTFDQLAAAVDRAKGPDSTIMADLYDQAAEAISSEQQLRRKIIVAYFAGHTMTEIAEATGRQRQTIRRIISTP